ncbi:cucumber peeling cupredoxin-like [Pyrus ussuriensis x Pyrus communis]|uniref:Cucumber peeling cupredoxin-like n=1 Tax=Pyrus ussuriensis x Pyrus communis TaxID=2448454 RepID=A0A5N5GTY1_9ROSA|nr:cucumber peeling cupredoxin-like [Pyrus ussuriensis x Pyrus communis]
MNMMIACLVVMAVASPSLLNLKGATAAEYVVGDSLGWTVPPNTSFYSDWAASKTFQIGDTVARPKSHHHRWITNHHLFSVGSSTIILPCFISHYTTLGSFVGLISALVAVASFVA